MIIMDTNSTLENITFFDSRAKEFVDIVQKGTYNELLTLYYRYKGFCLTGCADFVQRVVVEFMEEYCIELKNKLENKDEQEQRPTIDPLSDSEKTISNKRVLLRSIHFNSKRFKNDPENDTEVNFGDDWDSDFKEQPNTHHPSIQCDAQYASTTGSSPIPSVFQSHLYFRNAKYYLNLFSDPFFVGELMELFLHRFLAILYKYTTTSLHNNTFVSNPWNFTLYNAHHSPSAIIDLTFKYNSANEKHELIEPRTLNYILTSEIIYDMHRNEPYMTLFPVGYSCDAKWANNGTVGGAHAVVCGILKKEKTVFVFILDPNGVQVNGPEWWQKYTQILFKNTRKKISTYQKVEHFFNQEIVRVLIEQINKIHPDEYECTFDPKVNLNPYKFNIGGSAYQANGYCALISFFFIHLVYNNITIHNRDAFFKITDQKEIVGYLNELMLFIHKLINTPPFTNTHFFYNYSINIFRFMLSTKNVENYYDITSLVTTINAVNSFIRVNPHVKDRFSKVTSANVILIYMNIIIRGMNCIPSLIGVPKPNIRKYQKKLYKKDYSCIKFYTPMRELKDLTDQPLRLWFADDTEEVIFRGLHIFIYNERDKYKMKSFIERPHFVLLNLSKMITLLNDSTNYNSFIKDYKIMSPRDIHITHTNLNNKSTSDKKSCVIS